MAFSRFATDAPSSAVASVLHPKAGSANFAAETKSGAMIYWGDAANFHEWEFKTRLRLQNKEDKSQYTTQMSMVVEGLRGDAFVVAKDTVGLAKLSEPGSSIVNSGLEILIKEMKASVFPHTEHEAKELFR